MRQAFARIDRFLGEPAGVGKSVRRRLCSRKASTARSASVTGEPPSLCRTSADVARRAESTQRQLAAAAGRLGQLRVSASGSRVCVQAGRPFLPICHVPRGLAGCVTAAQGDFSAFPDVLTEYAQFDRSCVRAAGSHDELKADEKQQIYDWFTANLRRAAKACGEHGRLTDIAPCAFGTTTMTELAYLPHAFESRDPRADGRSRRVSLRARSHRHRPPHGGHRHAPARAGVGLSGRRSFGRDEMRRFAVFFRLSACARRRGAERDPAGDGGRQRDCRALARLRPRSRPRPRWSRPSRGGSSAPTSARHPPRRRRNAVADAPPPALSHAPPRRRFRPAPKRCTARSAKSSVTSDASLTGC
jgi:hypothetical protein